MPPVIVVPPPPPPPPPACPAGQHLTAGECQDPECGDDEIVGEDGTCTGCGDGEIPDDDGTACLTCEHGESTAGLCDPPCFRAANNKAAVAALKRYPDRKPFELGVSLYCFEHQVEEYAWISTEHDDDRCQGTVPLSYDEGHLSCWEGGNKQTGCNLSIAHTHPWFTEDDFGAKCLGDRIDDKFEAYDVNNGGMGFSTADTEGLHEWSINGQLGVSNRSCTKMYRRMDNTFGRVSTIDGVCVQPEEPEEDDDEEDEDEEGNQE